MGDLTPSPRTIHPGQVRPAPFRTTVAGGLAGMGSILLALGLILLFQRGISLFLPLVVLLLLWPAVVFTWHQRSLRWLAPLRIPALSVLTSLLIGGLIILVTDPLFLSALGQEPLGALSVAWERLRLAYSALLEGAFGHPGTITRGLHTWLLEGNARPLRSALRPVSESLVNSVPYMFAGLAVAIGFRGGLFNIGAEGQIAIGGLFATWVGFGIEGLPTFVHLPLAMAVGALAAGLWAAIPGVLKARTGAHEVITTIMMNYIALRLLDWLLTGPLEGPPGTARTPDVLPSAMLPRFFPHPIRLHAGLPLALVVALLMWYLLWKTTLGFEIRTVGANPQAARYAGIGMGRAIVLTMLLSGLMAGLGGAVESLGITRNMALGFSAGYGFDAIALALLGKSHPLGVVLAALLFGILRAGGVRMQSVADVPIELTSIVQALVIIFIAAPALVRALYRVRAGEEVALGPQVFTQEWR